MPTLITFAMQAGAHAAAAQRTAPRVFTAPFQARLAILNAATRELRQMGFHIVWSRLAGPMPQARIRRSASVSVAPLLDRMGPRSFLNEEGATVVSGEFEGILLSWAEPN
ncbi:hypothetical protein HCX48_00415 [Rhodocyclus tenuis]|uniref:Uncharacterized protein n=1 Tax=Rhodocyclus gracilis TaxID=2929842 RepID=A0ABX0WG64_9RHOO|nr:hypothetical protein [Rhodocyclus gracilis]MRD73309.1 hypothetical protein [Rhodocyclus gracilis]NJA87690.1 hypothetical protein [Rhodocyclus gracilis]